MSSSRLRTPDPYARLPRMKGAEGGWMSRTILASNPVFRGQYQRLSKDHTTGIFASDVKITVPDEFDGRKTWAKHLKPVRNQGSCGACWAFACAFALQTRLSIATKGAYSPNLSPSNMVICNMGSDREYEMAKAQIDKGEPYDFNLPQEQAKIRGDEVKAVASVGCSGETLIGAWQFLYRFGTLEEECVPYGGGTDLGRVTEGQKLPACADLLGDNYDDCPGSGKKARAHLASGYYFVPGVPARDKSMESGTEADIRRDIYHWGPASTGFVVHSDFMNWDGMGVYKWDGKASESDGSHAVAIVGWGNDPQQGPYWIVRNSWGEEWGDKGYFKIARGSNHCQIEENVVVGLPNLYGFRLYLEWPLLNRSEDLMLRTLWGIRSSGYKTTTLEQMVLGKIPGTRSELYEQQYDPKRWPDVSVMVAGDPRTLKFRIAEGTSLFRHPLRFASYNHDLAIGVAVGAVGASLLIAFVVHKASKKAVVV